MKRKREIRLKQKWKERFIVNLVQSVFGPLAVLMLYLMIFSHSERIIYFSTCLLCICLLGIYETRKTIREAKQWKNRLKQIQTFIKQSIEIASSFTLFTKGEENQPTTRMMKRKMKKFHFSLFKS